MSTTGHESEAINVQGLKASLQKLKTDHIDGKADEATTLAGYGITDAYTKTEVNGLVDTPHQNYVTVAATSQTTDVTTVLPASGQAADTIYRVSNWDGSANSGAGAFDVSCYSEYAWDDVSNPNKYVFLCVKSQIGEVFDISVYNNNAKYADLAAALNGGANIPQSLQKGGMSVKFVQSSDNKYVQARCMAQNFTTNVTQWQGVDDEPTAGSQNLVESGGMAKIIDGCSGLESYSGWPDSSNNIIASTNGKYKVIEVNGGESAQFINYASDGDIYIMVLASFTYNPILPYTPVYATGETGRRSASSGNNIELTLPSDAKYIIVAEISNATGDNVFPSQIIIDGIDLTLGLNDVRKEIPVLNNDTKVLKFDEGITSSFRGKRLSIIGDSVSTFDQEGYKIDGYRMYYPHGNITDVNQTYWKKLLNVSQMELEVNASWGGSCVTNVRQSEGYPDFYDRCNLLGNPDVIIVALGINDGAKNPDLGTLEYDKGISELSENNFCEAYIKGIKALKTNYPNAEIYCLSFDIAVYVFRVTIKAISEHFGLHYLDCSGYDQSTMTQWHPSADGMDYIANKIANDFLIEKAAEIECYIEKTDTSVSYTPTFEQGGFSDGNPTVRNDRIRTVDFIPVSNTVSASVGVLHDYVMQAHFYDINKIYLSSLTGKFSVDVSDYPNGAAYVRYAIAKNGRNPKSNYFSGEESSSQITTNDEHGFSVFSDKAVSVFANSLAGIDNYIENSSILDLAEPLDGYIKDTGDYVYATSWSSYIFKAGTLTEFYVKTYNSLPVSSYPWQAISFFNSETVFNASTFIIGRNFSVVRPGVWYKENNIPITAKAVIISCRNNDGSAEVKALAPIVRCKNNSLDIDKLFKLTAVLDDRTTVESYDSVGNAEFWLDFDVSSDFTWVGNRIVGFRSSSDDLTSTAGNIYIREFANGPDKTATSATFVLKHLWGHCNTVDYNADNDCLILGNGSGDYQLAGKIIIIPNFSSLVNVTADNNNPMSLADVNALVIDCASYNLGSKFNLVWGDDNDKNYNIAYLMTANINGTTSADGDDLGIIRKIVLRKDAEVGEYGSIVTNSTPFNGTFDIVEVYTQKTAGYDNCDQGTCYYNGELYAGIGHDGLWYWRMRMSDGIVFRKNYKQQAYCDNKPQDYGNVSGICVKDGYIFIGRSGIGVMAIRL